MTADMDGGGLRRANGGSEGSGFQCSEHGGGILIDHCQQRASWRFRSPATSLPVLDRVKAKAKRVREFGLCHAQSITDRLHVNFLGHICLESFLLSSKERLNVIKAIHHLLELRFHATSRRSRKYYRHVSSARSVPPSTGSLSHFSENRDQKNRKSLVTPDIYNPRTTTFPHPFACHPDLSKSARPADHVPTFWVGCDERYYVRTLVLTEELVGHGEIRRRLDNRLHNFSCTPLDTISQDNCVPLDTLEKFCCHIEEEIPIIAVGRN